MCKTNNLALKEAVFFQILLIIPLENYIIIAKTLISPVLYAFDLKSVV